MIDTLAPPRMFRVPEAAKLLSLIGFLLEQTSLRRRGPSLLQGRARGALRPY
jgi:hypothetical protein